MQKGIKGKPLAPRSGVRGDEAVTVGKFFDPDDDELTLEDFEDALQIDEHALDGAVQQQPDLFYRIAKKLALQISRRDAAKQYLANQAAQTDTYLRRQTMHQDEKRMTDKAIESQKLISVPVVKATDQLLRMEHSVREWTALKDAVVARGHALRELVELYVHAQYETGSVTIKADTRNINADRARREMSELRKGKRKRLDT